MAHFHRLLIEMTFSLLIEGTFFTFHRIVQSADWYFGAKNKTSPQPAYVRKSALATMVFCFFGMFAYFAYMVRCF